MRGPIQMAAQMAERMQPQIETTRKMAFPRMAEFSESISRISSLYDKEEEFVIPAFTRPIQEVRIVNPEDIAITSTKSERDFVIASYPLPKNAVWESLDIQFIDGHFVKVSYPNLESKKFNYKDMGFVNMKTTNPDLKWRLLYAIAENDGALTTTKWDRGFGRNVKYELNEGLKRFFGMATNPIPHYTKRDGYKPLFSIRRER
ncbi:MAG: hypothetical protein MUD00_00940 [Candidatus Pacebacteria bacterium]|nr:hypothetical protein [Candidatus Paceibacterota bacterium]